MKPCPRCGSPNSPEQRVCATCGAPLGAVPKQTLLGWGGLLVGGAEPSKPGQKPGPPEASAPTPPPAQVPDFKGTMLGLAPPELPPHEPAKPTAGVGHQTVIGFPMPPPPPTDHPSSTRMPIPSGGRSASQMKTLLGV